MQIILFLIAIFQACTCSIIFEPQQVLSDEQEVLIKEIFIYSHALTLQPWRHRVATLSGRAQEVLRGKFPCGDAHEYRSHTPPRSVHRLMPGDIDVIAAFGDSVTVGMGASAFTRVGSLIEDRGLSWIIGGQGTWRDALTIPNILLHFNPNLIGFSTGTGQVWSPQAGFNVAEPGALGIQMPYMARKLVDRIRNDRRVHFDTDWKMVTLKFGHNDACSEMCYLPRIWDIVDMMRTGLRDSLEYLSKNLPRTLVNVVPISRLELLPDAGLPLSCYLTNTIFCPCLFGPQFRKNKKLFMKVTEAIRNVFTEVVNEGRYDDREDFAVILQPFPLNLRLPTKYTSSGEVEPDVSVFAPDCFHFSQKGYARAANAMWNNMLQPVGSKYKDWAPVMQHFICPSPQHPYIFTKRNSLQVNSTAQTKSHTKL